MYHVRMADIGPKKSDFSTQRSYELNCPIAISLDLLGDRWTLLILRDLFIHSSSRYVQLRKSLQGISPTLLSQRIKELMNSGLIEQFEMADTGHVAYKLTTRGKETKPILIALARFGLPHLDGRVADKAWETFTKK
jgi:DNA-binding HxlR family transcriptional regulator